MNVNIPIAQPVIQPLATWEIEADQMGLQGEHRRLFKLASLDNSAVHYVTKVI